MNEAQRAASSVNELGGEACVRCGSMTSRYYIRRDYWEGTRPDGQHVRSQDFMSVARFLRHEGDPGPPDMHATTEVLCISCFADENERKGRGHE